MKSDYLKTVLSVLCSTLMFGTVLCFGQQTNNKKTTLGLLTFKALDIENNYMEAAELTNTVKELFVESKKYIPLDRSRYAETAKFDELEAQKNLAYINGVVAKQGKQNGAIVLVGGELTSVEYKNLDKGVQCLLNFTLTISDVETGELMATQVFSPSKVELLIPKADGVENITARSSKLLQLRNKINNFIIANTPFFVKMIKLEKDGRNTNILVEAGTGNGLEKGDRFEIYKSEKIGSSERLVPILKFGISEVQGDFSVGRIPRNKVNQLEELMNDPEVKLVCKQVECSFCPKI